MTDERDETDDLLGMLTHVFGEENVVIIDENTKFPPVRSAPASTKLKLSNKMRVIEIGDQELVPVETMDFEDEMADRVIVRVEVVGPDGFRDTTGVFGPFKDDVEALDWCDTAIRLWKIKGEGTTFCIDVLLDKSRAFKNAIEQLENEAGWDPNP